jgi:hypothetical protein
MVSNRVALAALVGVFALLFVHAGITGCDHDEVEALHASWLVSQGERPYKDFLEEHHPPVFYLFAPAARALSGSPRGLVFAARAADLVLLAGVLAVFLALARRHTRDGRWIWPALLLAGCFFFMRNSMEVRSDPWMSAFCLAALWQWSVYLRGGRAWHAALAGLCLGIGIAFLQKALVFAGFLALGTLPVLRPGRIGRTLAGGAILTAATAVPLAMLVFLVHRGGFWPDFYFWNYTFNRYYFLETHFEGPSAIAVLAVSIAENPLLWLGGLAGLWLALRRWREFPEKPELSLAVAVVIGLLASLFQSRWPFSHNLLLMQPSLALLAVYALEEVRTPRWRAALGVLALALVAKVGVLCFTYDEGHGNIRIQERILAETRPSDPIAASPPYNPIFRRDSFFFWYVPVNNTQAYLEVCRKYGCPEGKAAQDAAAWQSDPPRMVYLPADEPGWAVYDFDAHRPEYVPTDVPGLYRRSR